MTNVKHKEKSKATTLLGLQSNMIKIDRLKNLRLCCTCPLRSLIQSTCATKQTPRSFQWNGCKSVFISMRKIK